MTIDFFLNHYSFNDFVINKVVLKNHTLKLYVTINAHLDLIANGYRPELDVDYDTIFSFKVNRESYEFKKLDKFNCYTENEKYYISLDNNKFEIVSDEIMVEK